MSLSIGEAKLAGFATPLAAVLPQLRVERCRRTYEQNRHRVYCLAFLMTGNELTAEQLMIDTFCRAFAAGEEPSADEIDRALIAELRACMPLGKLTLKCAPCKRVLSVRRNTLRVHLECAVIQLPETEKLMFLMHDVEGYDHARIAGLLNVTEDASRRGVHQARLRLRELLAQ
ncbi:MAG TPA: sigma-70 family RNA polymerase sigma factor [Candidatus Binatia bacterium]|nr:sigma-70 family RNA polymerase sigma factor [Candidatus Binatia bacterium]